MFSDRKTIEETLVVRQLHPDGLKYIAFYDSGYENYIFANYYKKSPPLFVDGKKYITPEHYFQAQKFPLNSDQHQQIINQKSANDARIKAAELFKKLTEEQKRNWYKQSYDAMLNVISIRAQQDHLFKQKLLATGTHYILEDTYKGPQDRPDTKWGGGPDGQGENLLGLALMQVRYELNGNIQDLNALRERAKKERSNFSKNIGQPFRDFAAIVSSEQIYLPNPFEGKERPTDFIMRELSKTYKLQNVYLGNNRYFKDKGVLTFAFASQKDVDPLSKELLYKSYIDIYIAEPGNTHYIDMDLESDNNNIPQAQKVLEALGVKSYGLTHPQPINEMLKEQWKYEKDMWINENPFKSVTNNTNVEKTVAAKKVEVITTPISNSTPVSNTTSVSNNTPISNSTTAQLNKKMNESSEKSLTTEQVLQNLLTTITALNTTLDLLNKNITQIDNSLSKLTALKPSLENKEVAEGNIKFKK